MKSIFKILLPICGIVFLFTCSKEEIDVAALSDFPPSFVSIFPADGGKASKAAFTEVKVVFADGTTSPLSTGSLALLDGSGTEIASTSGSLSGTRDSLVIPGSEFNPADLPVGNYGLSISVTDSKGQEVTKTTTFELSLLPFAANHDEMFIAGGFNGWGADVMTLIGPNTWEIKEIDLLGDGWKFKNCVDWCDEDWGDADCDGRMSSNMDAGGNDNTACGDAGLVNVQFNDETLTYTVVPAVNFNQNISGLFLLGTFNNFRGSDYKFAQTADNVWELKDVLINMGDEFKFAEMEDFVGQNFGDSDGDGIAELGGDFITFGEQSGFYDITFNDKSLAYTFTFLRFPSIGIIGDATPGGWDSDTDLSDDDGDGIFEINIELTDGEAKFRANDDWAVNWGATDFPSGVGELNGPNIPIVAGTYDVTFNPATGEYTFTEDAGFMSMGIIGDATPGGWDADTDMIDNGDGTYRLVIGLTDGAVKFRADDDWADNWGATDFPSGTGTPGGDNIPVTAGIYLVTFNSATGEYNFGPASIGIIGSATPTGWDSDTDMTPTGASAPGELTLSIDLVDGEVKFRVNDDWGYNWGGADFPSGTAEFNGANIGATAGSYTVKLNVNTGAYSFE